MSEERAASLRNRWFTTSVAITAAIAVVGFAVGFLWIPLAQPGERFCNWRDVARRRQLRSEV